jgi:LuxR family maltose regulon positive regulatory protein
VRIVIAQREPGALAEVLRVLDRLAREAETASLLGVLIEIQVLRALALQAQGNLAAALPALESALMLAAPEGHVRLFVDEGTPMAELLAQSAAFRQAQEPRRGQNDSLRIYVEHLLSAFPESQREAQTVLRPALERSNALVESLSEREIEILRLIADGHSNQAIADRLIVAISTVKKHINNIYGKLDVQSRTQALVRARELKLL